jgi:hypothetical protein
LEEFFQSEDSSSAKTAAGAAQERVASDLQLSASQELKDAQQRKVVQEKAQSLADKNYEVKSYVAAYNEWQNTLVRLKAVEVQKPNKISVVFDKTFTENGGNKVYRQRDQIGTVASSPMVKSPDAKNGDNVRANQVQDNFTFVAGTQITQVINTAMQSSEFIRKQIVLQEQAKAGGVKEVQGLVTWWKIIPLVKLQEFDNKNNQWSFDTTYYVVPYTLWNTTHPNLPKAVPDRNLCSKEYSYFYTGQNNSVIDFAIDFDFIYFTKVIALRNKNTDNQYNGERTNLPEASGESTKGKGINPGVINYTSDDPANAGKNLRGDATAMAVGNVAESLYSSAAGEMLNITLKIIGDPELIKQDDVFTGVTALLKKTNEVNDTNDTNPTFNNVAFQQNRNNQADPTKKNNNSIIMDSAEVVCWVEIKTPVDIDDLTGGVRFYDNNKIKSGFTGVYKMLMVDSEFSRGQFTQTLNLIRYMDQDFSLPEDRSFDIAEANRLSNYPARPGIKPGESAVGGTSLPVYEDPLGDFIKGLPNSEVTVSRVPQAVVDTIYTAVPIPGGNLVQYNYTVR